MPQEDVRIGTITGYLLKNNARLILRAAPDVTEFVKAAVLTAFNDASVMVRGAAAQDIVAFLGILEPKNWPECLQQLVHMLDVPNADQQEVRATISVSSSFLPFSSRPAVSRASRAGRSWLRSHMEILPGHRLLSLAVPLYWPQSVQGLVALYMPPHTFLSSFHIRGQDIDCSVSVRQSHPLFLAQA